MRFEFATATRILFGPGMLSELPNLAKGLGSHPFLILGHSQERARRVLDLLGSTNLRALTFSVPGEPTTELVRDGVRKAREGGADLVISFGGGSVIDTGKAIAALLANEGDLFDYLEVIGTGRALSQPSLPFIAIPTTAGPGTEVTRNAVLASPVHRVKVSLRSAGMLPKVALVDPELTYDLPPAVTAATGLDALTQLIEPFLSVRANPLTDVICRDGMVRIARSLVKAFDNGHNEAARMDMSLSSLYGGLALANAGLGAVHGFAGPIGGMFPAPHGTVCASLLPAVMEVNLRALQKRAPDSVALQRMDEVARLSTGSHNSHAVEAIQWLKDLCAKLRIPNLRHYKITEADVPAICEKAALASSMKGNPIALTREEMKEILELAL